MKNEQKAPQQMINEAHWKAHLARVFKRNPKKKPRTYTKFTRMIKVNGENSNDNGGK